MNTAETILNEAIGRGLVDDEHPWAVFFDLDALQERFDRLERAFPADALHAVAIKANPLTSVLKKLVERGAGLEAASWGEVELARRAGAEQEAIVFDSPAKTKSEIGDALAGNLYLNADNLSELERIADAEPSPEARIGIRVNPVVGAGDIEATSVSTKSSKFGVSLLRRQRALVEVFRRHRWLRGLHVHTGSQGCGVDLLVEGVRRCVDFAGRVDHALGEQRIEIIDIGGGLPVAYRPHVDAPTIEEYASALRDAVPELFERRRRVITEFGRWLYAPCAFAASRVEYVKELPGGPLAVIHFGADLLLRRAYRPDDWYHRLTVHDATGKRSAGEEADVTVAGPLCFSGDVLARQRRLPRPEAGDYVIAHDVGAYTFSMWSRYCSRRFPRVFGFQRLHDGNHFEVLHPGESNEDLVDFWKR